MNREERRALARQYTRHDRSFVCGTCSSKSVVTYFTTAGEVEPEVAVLHHEPDADHPAAWHEPVLSGNSAAARARREGSILGQHRETLG